VLVLDYGKKIAEGTASAVQNDPKVVAAYLGRRRVDRPEGPLMPGPLLELKKLEVAYGGIHAVKGIDLEIGEGELVCLIGANGAGKTTTLKGICGLLPVKAGKIFYGGADITGQARVPAGASGTRDGARRSRRIRRADHRGKPGDGRLHPQRRGRHQGRHRARLPPLSAPERAPPADRGHDVGRRTADAGDGPRDDVASQAAAARRAVDGTGAADGAEVFETIITISGEGVTICSSSRTRSWRSRSASAAT
jgi:energy-coupling factor transporter ATP-binding protein EcfA2